MSEPAQAAFFKREPPPKAANPAEPHWVVKRMSRHGPGEFKSRLLFMHPSLELAEKEARRLAETNPGKRFSVYGSVSSFKVPAEKAAAEPPE